MAHSLGGYLDLPHGECNAILLPVIVSYNYEACPERFDRIAEAMGLDLTGCDAAKRSAMLVGKIAEIRDQVGILSTIGHLGVTRSDVPRLADFALKDACMSTNRGFWSEKTLRLFMNPPSDRPSDFLRDKLIGLGETSLRKNYYPELQRRLEELESFRNLLDKVSDGILMVRCRQVRFSMRTKRPVLCWVCRKTG